MIRGGGEAAGRWGDQRDADGFRAQRVPGRAAPTAVGATRMTSTTWLESRASRCWPSVAVTLPVFAQIGNEAVEVGGQAGCIPNKQNATIPCRHEMPACIVGMPKQFVLRHRRIGQP
jgi:hypothetical protein